MSDYESDHSDASEESESSIIGKSSKKTTKPNKKYMSNENGSDAESGSEAGSDAGSDADSDAGSDAGSESGTELGSDDSGSELDLDELPPDEELFGDEDQDGAKTEGTKTKSKKAKTKEPKPKGKKQQQEEEMGELVHEYFGDSDYEDDEDDYEDEYGEEYLQKFDETIREAVLENHHKELLHHNYEEVEALTNVARDERGIIVDPLHRTIPILTKYEKARILGERAKQINGGAKPFIKVREGVIDGYLIACEELEHKKIPFIIRRPINGGFEYWRLKDLEVL